MSGATFWFCGGGGVDGVWVRQESAVALCVFVVVCTRFIRHAYTMDVFACGVVCAFASSHEKMADVV